METTLDYYARKTKSRFYTNKNQVGEKQCRGWQGAPMDSKSQHPGTRIYNYLTHDKYNSEVWLCSKCLREVAEMNYLAHRREYPSKVAQIPEISIEEIASEKTNDVLLVVKWSDDEIEKIRCKAYPPF